MRISTSQIFSQSLRQINSSLSDVNELTIMNTTQKRINSSSDDPAGMGKVMELDSYKSSLTGYIDNCSTANEYLELADSVLQNANENVLIAMVELAEQGATETYTDVQLDAMATEMESYLDSLFNIANTESGTDSIFAGNDTQGEAYTIGLGVTIPDDNLSNASFTSITGEAEDTIWVQFDSSGEIGTDALDYRYSTDGGDTWTSATLAAGDTTLDLDTAQVEMLAGTDVSVTTDSGGTEFMVREAMYYTGSDIAQDVAISESTSVEMNTVGSTIFGGVDSETGQPYEDPNLFETISDCIVYLETGDHEAVADCLEAMRTAKEKLETGAADIGARENLVTYTQSAQETIKSMTTSAISSEEDADAAQLIIELEQANYIYQAVLSTSADVMEISLLNYL